MHLSTRTAGDFEIVEVTGEIDVYTAPRLREAIVELVDSGHRQLIVDVERVEFLDSTGLGVLVGGLKKLQEANGTLDIVCSQDRIRKIFAITGLDQVFGFYDNVPAATAVR